MEKNNVIKEALGRMLITQEELDSHILASRPEMDKQDLFNKRALSLSIEIGELANELPEVFKYWSNKKNDYEKALVEYADCLHFILSIANLAEYEEIGLSPSTTDDMVVSFLDLQGIIVYTRHAFHLGQKHRTHQNFQHLLNEFLHLGTLIGFTWEDIEYAYYNKNKENYKRQEDGY